jgi:hypothetical protein
VFLLEAREADMRAGSWISPETGDRALALPDGLLIARIRDPLAWFGPDWRAAQASSTAARFTGYAPFPALGALRVGLAPDGTTYRFVASGPAPRELLLRLQPEAAPGVPRVVLGATPLSVSPAGGAQGEFHFQVAADLWLVGRTMELRLATAGGEEAELTGIEWVRERH